MASEFLVSDPTRIELQELIRERGNMVGGVGAYGPMRPARLKAGYVRFTLPGALATTDASKASCTVNGYWGGPNPGSTVTVYNLPASSNYIFSGASGAKGLATYDDVDDKYWIVQMECP